MSVATKSPIISPLSVTLGILIALCISTCITGVALFPLAPWLIRAPQGIAIDNAPIIGHRGQALIAEANSMRTSVLESETTTFDEATAEFAKLATAAGYTEFDRTTTTHPAIPNHTIIRTWSRWPKATFAPDLLYLVTDDHGTFSIIVYILNDPGTRRYHQLQFWNSGSLDQNQSRGHP